MAKKTKKASALPALSGVNSEFILITDSSGKCSRVSLADLRNSLLAGADLNDEYDGVFIMTHRKSDNYPVAYRPEAWTAQQKAGEIADGVLLVQGNVRLVIAPTESPNTLYWASANIAGGGYTTSDRVASSLDMAGKGNTTAQIGHTECAGVNYAPGFCHAYSRTNANGQGLTAGKWWLPSLGEMFAIWSRKRKINHCLSLIEGATLLADDAYWTSTEYSSTTAWYLNLSNGYQLNSRNKSTSQFRVRAVSAFIS